MGIGSSNDVISSITSARTVSTGSWGECPIAAGSEEWMGVSTIRDNGYSPPF